MTTIPTRVLLQAIDDVAEHARWVAGENGWTLDREYEIDDEGQPAELVFVVPGLDGFLHVIDDHHAGFAYAFAVGADFVELLNVARAEFPIIGDDLIAESLDSEDEYTRSDAVVALALRAQDVEPDVLRAEVQAKTTDTSAVVRAAAILAIGYLEDASWLPVLDAMASDTDETVASEASRIAAGIRITTETE